MNETDKLIEEQLKTLPPNLQQAISIVPWKALVQEIGQASALDTEQIVSLEQETMLVVYAFEDPNDYVSNIIKEVGVPEDIAYAIAEPVADKIFEPILKKSEELEKPTEIKTGPITLTSVSTTPPTNLPMVEKSEVVHDARPLTPERSDGGQVPHVEQSKPEIKPEQTKVPLPDYRYPGGQDPYREPLA